VEAELGIAEVTTQTATMHRGVYAGITPTFSFEHTFYNPVFSPDEETLFFVSLRPPSDPGFNLYRFGTIFRVPVHDLLQYEYGNEHSPLPDIRAISPENQLAGYPSLSSDGEWLVYAVKEEESANLWVQTIDGRRRQRLTAGDFINIQPVWQPSN
jgi:Tol biopolymer transport system component